MLPDVNSVNMTGPMRRAWALLALLYTKIKCMYIWDKRSSRRSRTGSGLYFKWSAGSGSGRNLLSHKIWSSKLFSTLIIIRNVSWVKIVDSENWSNDEENYTLHHRNNITFYNILKLKTFFKFVNLFHNIAVFFYFNQIHFAFMSRRYLFQNHELMFPNFWQVL